MGCYNYSNGLFEIQVKLPKKLGTYNPSVFSDHHWPLYRVASDDHNTCSSANFSTNGLSYQRVCGRARGYQKGYTWASYGSAIGRTIDETYVSGLSVTSSHNPRHHIWTFASGYSETVGHDNCPCSVLQGHSPSSFVGINYYCESGSSGYPSGTAYYFNDILWDGADCNNEGTCCDNTTQPWFFCQLDRTMQDDIEAKICAHGPFSGRSTLIDQLELYIQ